MHGYFIIYQVVTKVDVYGLRLPDRAAGASFNFGLQMETLIPEAPS